MANNTPDPADDRKAQNLAAANWPDLYSLLDVAADADTDTLRRRIRDAYMDAASNVDHRVIERRIHFQTLVERIIPQSRRILLDPELRERYDRELARHRAGDSQAIDFGTFVSSLASRPEDTLAGEGGADDEPVPGREGEFNNTQEASPQAGSRRGAQAPPAKRAPTPPAGDADEGDDEAATLSSASSTLPRAARPRRAMKSAPMPPVASPTENSPASTVQTDSVAEGFAGQMTGEVAPAIVSSQPSPEAVAVAVPPPSAPPPAAEIPPVAGAGAALDDTSRLPSAASEEDFGSPAATDAPGDTAEPAVEADADASTGALYASVIRPEGPSLAEHTTAHLNLDAASETARRRANTSASRVSLGENDLSRRAAGRTRGGVHLISHTAQLLATAICAALLTLYILRTNLAAAAAPLRIAYASDMKAFMEQGATKFRATGPGKSAEIELQLCDSRDGMSALLSGQLHADAWIPAESLWTKRYNEVAGAKHRPPINVGRSLAQSPFVLVARGDHAALLHHTYPDGMVKSWPGLIALIATGAKGHFGMTDPTSSGAGAIARYLMAEDWCRRHQLPFNKLAAQNGMLWQWMGQLETNIPSSERLSGDLVKQLALGTADRYWWAIAYESDAISWINRGKTLDVFYLPQTMYADHPYCTIDQPGTEAGTRQARALFEQYLRSTPMQQALLQNGLRPTEIEVSTNVANNPFTTARYRARGIKASGFPSNGRINYRTLNALTAAWVNRYAG